MAVDRSVSDLLALVKSTLNAEEIALISTPDTRNNEPDAYTALLNHFTQKNTDAIVKCKSVNLWLLTPKSGIEIRLNSSLS